MQAGSRTLPPICIESLSCCSILVTQKNIFHCECRVRITKPRVSVFASEKTENVVWSRC